MPVTWERGDMLGRGDLDVFLTNASGNPANAYQIMYSIVYVDPGPPEMEIPLPSQTDRVPLNAAVGEYYAPMQIPWSARYGTYRIRWIFMEFVDTPPRQVTQEFSVVEDID